MIVLLVMSDTNPFRIGYMLFEMFTTLVKKFTGDFTPETISSYLFAQK